MKKYVTYWIDAHGNYKLPSVSGKSRYIINFAPTAERLIVLADNFITAFNSTWGKIYGIIDKNTVAYIYRSEIMIK